MKRGERSPGAVLAGATDKEGPKKRLCGQPCSRHIYGHCQISTPGRQCLCLAIK